MALALALFVKHRNTVRYLREFALNKMFSKHASGQIQIAR